MDYAKHYSLLINRAVGRTLEGYTEKHHILPRCMSGTDDPANLVKLTAREHFVAHQLLVKMHPGVGNRDRKAAGEMLKKSRAGKENGRSRPVVQLFPNGFIVAEFPNMKAAAVANGHDKHTIYDRVKRGHPLWVGV